MHPAVLSYLLKKPGPSIELLDLQESTTANTTYTFSNCALSGFGGSPVAGGATFGSFSFVRSRLSSAVIVLIHGEDDATAFTVSTVTIGGVSLTAQVNRGGGTTAVNSAIFIGTGSGIQARTNDDVVITFSEAVTACTMAVLRVDNFVVADAGNAPTTAVGTGELVSSVLIPTPDFERYPLFLLVSTCIGTPADASFHCGGSSSKINGCFAPNLLYSGSNSTMSYAAAWTYFPGYMGAAYATEFGVNWSSAAGADFLCLSYC